jgi:hypothetical protein
MGTNYDAIMFVSYIKSPIKNVSAYGWNDLETINDASEW